MMTISSNSIFLKFVRPIRFYNAVAIPGNVIIFIILNGRILNKIFRDMVTLHASMMRETRSFLNNRMPFCQVRRRRHFASVGQNVSLIAPLETQSVRTEETCGRLAEFRSCAAENRIRLESEKMFLHNSSIQPLPTYTCRTKFKYFTFPFYCLRLILSNYLCA